MHEGSVTLSTRRRAVKPGFWVCAVLALAVPLVAGAVVINEIRIDQIGTDNDEYFELFGTGGESLDGVSYLVIGDFPTGVIEHATDLTGNAVQPTGYFLAAEATFSLGVADLTTSLNFENSDNVTHLLVTGFTGSVGDNIDGDANGRVDSTPWSGILDCVALIEEPNPPANTEWEYASDLGYPTIGPDGSYVPGQVYRYGDGTGPWTIGVFDPIGTTDTPGGENIPVELASLTVTSGRGCVVVRWTTQSETDNLGFWVWRSLDGEEYARLNDALIPGQGTSSVPVSYRYTDGDVQSGTCYYYQLEDVDVSGSGTFHGPIQVVYEAAASWGSLKASFRQ
jgi:hypothetical protein